MKCPKCDFQNPEGAKFCMECGNRLAAVSGVIPTSISYDEKLKRLQRYLPEGLTEKILSEKNKIEGELRHVTVMFCDMKGFTPLSAKLGPDRTFSLMDKVFEILIHKVNECEGTVNELRGDGILALFGAPIALEEAPVRALQSALAIQLETAKFNEKISAEDDIPPILFRIGINSGPVVVGSVGNDLRVHFTAVGDTINMAARMEGLAEPGATYVTEETYGLTRRLFDFEPLGEMKVKGKKDPVNVYRLKAAKEEIHRPRLGSERMIYSTLVGRYRELETLESQVIRAINGKGSIVNIIGEAGIGKSRLVAELKSRQALEKATFLEGRAISMGRNLSFHPVIDLLRHWAGIRHDDGEATALRKIEKTVTTYCSQGLYEILPFVATLMGIKLSGRYAERIKGIEGEALEKLILKSVRDLLTSASELTPLVIVTEDLQWSDMSSIELLEALFRLAETQRILFVNVFRPGYGETGDRIADTVRNRFHASYVEIVLEPLNDKLSESLIANMLDVGELHRPFIRTIVQRAGGNPFFIEEVVRSLIDENIIILKEGTFQLTEEIGTIAIPHTIHDLLMARIDRLEESTRNLLKIASVIGRSFFYKILSDVADSVPNIDGRLSYLEEIQLVRERRRMGEVEYLFKHALSQEAAYESILPVKRRQLHLKVADSIKKIFGDRVHEFYGMLAYHYSKAESIEEAEEYLIKAGEEALRSSASNEALNYYREALDLYLKKTGDAADSEKVAMFDKNIALALYNRGQYEEAVEYFDKSLFYYWKYSSKHFFMEFFIAFIHVIITIYFPAIKFKRLPPKQDMEAIDLFNKKLKALAIINPKKFFTESFHFLKRATQFDFTEFESGYGLFVGTSTLFSFTGISFKLSKKVLDFVKYKIDNNDLRQFTVYVFSDLLHNYLKGDWHLLPKHDEELIDKNLSIGDIYWASQLYHWRGWPNIYQGNLDTSHYFIDRLDSIYNLYENELTITLKYLLSTSYLMEIRKLDEALTEIEKGIEFGKKIGLGTSLIHLFSCQARIWLLKGNIDFAQKCLEQANKIRNEVNTVPWMLSHFCRSRLEYDLYRLESSIERKHANSSKLQKSALKSAKVFLKQSKKVAQHRTESYKLMGIYYWRIGSRDKALRWWQRAIEEGQRLGARLELSRTYFDVGKRLLEGQGRHKTLMGIKAKDYLEKARLMFEEMKLDWDLAEWRKAAKG